MNLLQRLNRHFILADFAYNDTVIRKNHPNYMGGNIDNGRALADTLAGIVDLYGRISITYGFISPELSRQIVRYQNPDIPSHHRWDLGAAADIIVHEWVKPKLKRGQWVYRDHPDASPIMLATQIADAFDYSRMITYSESPCICIAVKANENPPRLAFYENRYTGQERVKPLFRSYHKRSYPKPEKIHDNLGEHGWVGKGHPTHHGGGRRQYHHVQIGRYLTALDCLKCPWKVTEGIHNRAPHNKGLLARFLRVGLAMSRWFELWGKYSTIQPSIVAGHGSNFWKFANVFKSTDDRTKALFDWTLGKQAGMLIAVPKLTFKEEGGFFEAVDAIKSEAGPNYELQHVGAAYGSNFFVVWYRGER